MSTASDTSSPPGLSALHAQAEADASRFFGDAPSPAWHAEASLPTLARPVWWRVACAIAVGIVAVIVATVFAKSVPATVPPPPASSANDVVDDSPAELVLAAPRPSRAPMASSLNVRRQGAWWHIEAVAASRLDAARELARLNGLPLRGATTWLLGAQALDLHWQGRDPAAAWRAVLGTEVNYALQCDDGHCTAWIIQGDESTHGSPSQATNAALAGAGSSAPDNAAEAPPPRDRVDPPDESHRD